MSSLELVGKAAWQLPPPREQQQLQKPHLKSACLCRDCATAQVGKKHYLSRHSPPFPLQRLVITRASASSQQNPTGFQGGRKSKAHPPSAFVLFLSTCIHVIPSASPKADPRKSGNRISPLKPHSPSTLIPPPNCRTLRMPGRRPANRRICIGPLCSPCQTRGSRALTRFMGRQRTFSR